MSGQVTTDLHEKHKNIIRSGGAVPNPEDELNDDAGNDSTAGSGGGAGGAQDKRFDFVFKFIIIGDTGTGKSCSLHQFVEGKFQKGPPRQTIGVEFGSRVVTIGGKRIKLQIWDTAGQERFRSVTRGYYRGAVGALIFYDITNRDTFEHLESWMSDARMLTKKHVSIVVVGNKTDLSDQRAVGFVEGSRFAQNNNAMFVETSAMTGQNVEEVFLKATRETITKIDDGLIDLDDMIRRVPLQGKKEESKGGDGGGGGGCAC